METAGTSIQSGGMEGILPHHKRVFALRMAPMIDIIFLLLIFFLVAAKWRPQEDFLPFSLPSGERVGSSSVKPEALVVYISSVGGGCSVEVGGEVVTIENMETGADMSKLGDAMSRCLLAQKRYASDPVEIVCDGGVRSEDWIKIYNMFYGAGLTDITFAMTP